MRKEKKRKIKTTKRRKVKKNIGEEILITGKSKQRITLIIERRKERKKNESRN